MYAIALYTLLESIPDSSCLPHHPPVLPLLAHTPRQQLSTTPPTCPAFARSHSQTAVVYHTTHLSCLCSLTLPDSSCLPHHPPVLPLLAHTPRQQLSTTPPTCPAFARSHSQIAVVYHTTHLSCHCSLTLPDSSCLPHHPPVLPLLAHTPR